MAQVKTESKEIFLALSLQLCEPMNLLEKERMLLTHFCTCYDKWICLKNKRQQNTVRPLDRLAYHVTVIGQDLHVHQLKVLITVTQTETRRLNMTVQC